jgi:hypothetical protein
MEPEAVRPLTAPPKRGTGSASCRLHKGVANLLHKVPPLLPAASDWHARACGLSPCQRLQRRSAAPLAQPPANDFGGKLPEYQQKSEIKRRRRYIEDFVRYIWSIYHDFVRFSKKNPNFLKFKFKSNFNQY